MTTQLSTRPIDKNQLSILDLVTDTATPLGKLHADDFRAACLTVADFDGWVNPNHVSAELHARFGEIKPQWLSAMWSGSCGPNGFMDKLDVLVPIDPTHSRGNGNKDVRLRRLRASP